jgi:hypothetical protein
MPSRDRAADKDINGAWGVKMVWGFDKAFFECLTLRYY